MATPLAILGILIGLVSAWYARRSFLQSRASLQLQQEDQRARKDVERPQFKPTFDIIDGLRRVCLDHVRGAPDPRWRITRWRLLAPTAAILVESVEGEPSAKRARTLPLSIDLPTQFGIAERPIRCFVDFSDAPGSEEADIAVDFERANGEKFTLTIRAPRP